MVEGLHPILIGGKEIILRYPTRADTRKLQRFINTAIRESLAAGGYLSMTKQVTLKEEKQWMKSTLEKMRKKQALYILAECKGKIIGSTSIEKQRGAMAHIGAFGIAVLDEFTSKGLGTTLMETILALAKKKLRTEIVELRVFADNRRAYSFYKKIGFEEIGRICKGKKFHRAYADMIIMAKYL